MLQATWRRWLAPGLIVAVAALAFAASAGASTTYQVTGKLRFSFKYWAQFDATGALVWGSCVHPITGGTGAFADAKGVLAKVDTPTAQGVSTSYIGHVTLGGGSRRHASARVASAAAC